MVVYFFLILLVCVLDQLTKLYAMDIIAAANNISADELYGGCTKPIIEGVLNFTYKENPGMAFGLLEDKRWIFLSLSAVGILLLFFYLIYIKGQSKLMSVSLSLLIGGGIGNMFDRISLEYVVDFIDVRFIPGWVWIFNLADSAVCIGAALMMLSVLLEYWQEKKK